LELNHAKDESYTPHTVILMAGDSPGLLVDVQKFTISEGEKIVSLDFAEGDENVPAT